MTGLDAQLADYLSRGWRLLPCSWELGARWPLIDGGFRAASANPRLVASWWERWPLALCAVATGIKPMGSGVVVVDVDPRHDGPATLARLIGPDLPLAPTVHSPRDGLHYYFAAPGPVFSTVGIGGKVRRGLGPGVDVKADKAQCHCPGPSPLSRYRWDEERNLKTTALPILPAVLTPVEVVENDEDLGSARARERPIGNADAYAEAALKKACERIRETEPGRQRTVLNSEAFSMGRLAAGLDLDRALVTRELIQAGMQMPAQSGRDPWRIDQVRRVVRDGFADGLRKPKAPQLRSPPQRARR